MSIKGVIVVSGNDLAVDDEQRFLSRCLVVPVGRSLCWEPKVQPELPVQQTPTTNRKTGAASIKRQARKNRNRK